MLKGWVFRGTPPPSEYFLEKSINSRKNWSKHYKI
jgi:hypothetical protein